MENQELPWNRPEELSKTPIMMLDAWTQTTEDDQCDDVVSSNYEDEAMNKMRNILEQMRNQSKRIDELSQRRYRPAFASCDESEFYPKKYLKLELQQMNEDYKKQIASAKDSSIDLNVTEVKMDMDKEKYLPLNSCTECPGSAAIVSKFEESHQFSGGLKRKRHLIATSTPYSETKKVLNFNSPLSSSSNVAYVKPIPTDRTSIVITATDEEMVVLGPNNTQIPKIVFDSISWRSTSIATRKLLMTMFDRYTLATHSMSGKPSPAFKNDKPLKEMLNPAVIADIIFAVKCKCGSSERDIRNAITTKCADENKMLKLKERKNKENLNRN